jgi:hypothetical protein
MQVRRGAVCGGWGGGGEGLDADPGGEVEGARKEGREKREVERGGMGREREREREREKIRKRK